MMEREEILPILQKIDCEHLVGLLNQDISERKARRAQVELRVKKYGVFLERDEIRTYNAFRNSIDSVFWKNSPKYNELHIIGAKKSFVGDHSAAIDVYLIHPRDTSIEIGLKKYHLSSWIFPKHPLHRTPS